MSLQTGLLIDSVFGTSAGISETTWCGDDFSITTAPAVRLAEALLGAAQEVRSLRDRISSRGLTRQDIARALGVDRRSLSGWVRGDIRPTDDRIIKLRLLARLVADVDAERPGRARGLLLDERSGQSLLDRFAREGSSLLTNWPESVRHDYRTRVTRRAGIAAHPIWEAAARALTAAPTPTPDRSRTVRTSETYEMDLGEASTFDERASERRRQSYR
jgi:transcriptional regulator with XRE-family HTH domain